MSSEHVIRDDETRGIAEVFLESTPGLGDVEWGELTDEPNPPSWRATFADAAGTEYELFHERVIEGLRAIVYGPTPSGGDAGYVWLVRDWFGQPAAERRAEKLDESGCSIVCQQAVFGAKFLRTQRERAMWSRVANDGAPA
jgi:hypothetical protein